MKKLFTISEAEYQVMRIIWKKSPVSTNEVIDILGKTSTWSPKTIQTLLSRLTKKGILDYKKDSRVFVYTPLIKEDEYLAQESDTFLKRFYKGTLNSMVVNFLKQDKLSDEDIKELKDILDESLKKGEK